MGQASGKLTISHVDNKSKQDTHGENEACVVQTINAAQIVNGDISNAPDLPSIDGDAEPANIKHNASGEAQLGDHSTEHGPNGSVHTTEELDSTNVTAGKQKDEKSTKKTKNPLVWIQRRLSKRMSTSKKVVTDKESDVDADTNEAAPPEENAQTAATSEQQQVVETASSLVDQVLNTAMVQQISEHSTEQTSIVAAIPTEITEPQLEKSAPETVAEPTDSVNHVSEEQAPEMASTTENEAQQELTSQPEEIEDVNQVQDEPVLDTNNTNAACVTPEEQEPPEHGETETAHFDKSDEQGLAADGDTNVNGHDYEQDEDVMAAKLANLELTNGHSEQHTINNGVHSDVVVNGE